MESREVASRAPSTCFARNSRPLKPCTPGFRKWRRCSPTFGRANALQRTDELKQLLERQERWLIEARQTVTQVQWARENDMHRFWRGVVTRWVIAAIFAIAAAAAAGGAYVAFTRPYDRELEQLRTQAAFGQFVEQRALSMSAAERRQFDALMRWPRAAGARNQSKPEH